MAKYSIVEYFGGDSEGHRCGYCKNSNTNYSHGMWAHRMTCLDYQDLIDRGWRRSGKYVYKPTMKKLCCPMYTIKCDAAAFHPSKSQKKVLKKMTKFLTVTKTEPSTCQDDDKAGLHDSSRTHFVEPLPGKIRSDADKMKDINMDKLAEKDFKGVEHFGVSKMPRDCQKPSSSGQTTKPDKVVNRTESVKGKTPVPGKGPDPNKPLCKKAKILQMERKKQKLALAKEKGIMIDSKSSSQMPKVPTTKSLEDLVIDRLPSQQPVHDLQVKLMQVNMRSEEFQATYKQTCDLFAKYQMAIHKDSPGDCGELQFRRFLVDSPLEHYTGPGSPPMGFGSFHQQYFLDSKLVAVGVIDILPRCVSSVYLFYDPDFSFLSLGVYSALRELHFTRSLQRTTASIQSYYMGFYIHSCPKMRYKGQYSPSYLVCPETYNWIPIEQCRPKLDRARYARLDDSDEEAPRADTDDALILFEQQAMPYQIYAAISRANDHEEVQEYAELVGPVVCSRMLLFRSG